MSESATMEPETQESGTPTDGGQKKEPKEVPVDVRDKLTAEFGDFINQQVSEGVSQEAVLTALMYALRQACMDNKIPTRIVNNAHNNSQYRYCLDIAANRQAP